MHGRLWASGAFGALSLMATGLAAMASLTPSSHLLGPLSRMLDAAAPHLFAAGLVAGVASSVLGSRLLGRALAIAAAVGGALLFSAWWHLTDALPAQASPDLRVLFFNTGGERGGDIDALVASAGQTGADVLVFAEAGDALAAALEERYAFVSPCQPEACEILVATNLPVVRFWRLGFNDIWAERYAVLEVENPGGGRLFVSAVHLVKPWFSGIAEGEIAQLTAQYNWFEGPVVAVGDFNAPAWSLPLRKLLAETGFRGVRGQPASWPIEAGWLGLPIDQALVSNGARVTSLVPFGSGQGSNHLGFVAGVTVRGDG